MKNFFCVFCLALVLIGCDAPKNPEGRPLRELVPTPTPTPVVAELTPIAVGVSLLVEDFTKAPNCDGGECFDIEFAIGLELPGEGRSRSVRAHYSARTSEASNGAVKTDPEIKEGRRMHALIPRLDAKQVRVTLVGNKITKIEFVGQMIGTNYTPPETLWEANKF